MADNVSTQSAAPATPSAGTVIAARAVTYSGDSSIIAPVGLVSFAGADDAKVVFDLGGYSSTLVIAAASTNATNLKASAGLLISVNIFNNAVYPVYVKFHNTAGTPTAGSGVLFSVGCQAGASRDVYIAGGRYFATGIGFTIVKDITLAGATGVALSDCEVNFVFA